MNYTNDFYEIQRNDSLKSAYEIIPLVIEFLEPKSVLDIGCGTGTWLSVFKENGINNILGVDGEWVDKKLLMIDQKDFYNHDFTKPLKLNKHFDLVISLEVAEHLPEECAEGFVETLVAHGNVILFSAAIPFQSGVGHVNEQWPEYWVDLFAKKNYQVIDCFRSKIWYNPKVAFWYSQNMLLFVKENCLKQNHKILAQYNENKGIPLNIIHPEAYLLKSFERVYGYKNILMKLFENKKYDAILDFKDFSDAYIDFYVGRSFKELKKYKEAAIYLNRFIATMEEHFTRDSLLYDKGSLTSAYLHCGIAFYEIKENEKAKNCFERCFSLSDNQHNLAKEYIMKLGG